MFSCNVQPVFEKFVCHEFYFLLSSIIATIIFSLRRTLVRSVILFSILSHPVCPSYVEPLRGSYEKSFYHPGLKPGLSIFYPYGMKQSSINKRSSTQVSPLGDRGLGFMFSLSPLPYYKLYEPPASALLLLAYLYFASCLYSPAFKKLSAFAGCFDKFIFFFFIIIKKNFFFFSHLLSANDQGEMLFQFLFF